LARVAANPLEEIRNTRTIDSVYLEGVRLDGDAEREKFKQPLVDRDAEKAKTKKDYVPHPAAGPKAECAPARLATLRTERFGSSLICDSP
jgi:hypothetical protein